MHSIPTFGLTTLPLPNAIPYTSQLPLVTLPWLPGVNTILPLYPQDIPSTFVKWMLDLEYVANDHSDSEPHCCGRPQHTRPSWQNRSVAGLLCPNGISIVLCSPTQINHFMAYQQCIIKAHQLFVSDAWITYDTCYRWKAASTKLLDWGIRDGDLYNECFRGKSQVYQSLQCLP